MVSAVNQSRAVSVMVSRLQSERSVGMGALRFCHPVRSLFLRWFLSPALLMWLYACGPAPSDLAPGMESRTNLSGVSGSYPIPREGPSSPNNNPTKPVRNFAPLVSVPDQKKDPAPRPDRSLLSDRAQPPVDVSEQPGALPLMNVWTQEGMPLSVAVLEDPIDDASLEEDADNERRNWDVAHGTELVENGREQDEQSGERNE